MAYRVLFEDGAARELRKLPKDSQGRVVAKAEALARDPRPSGCQKLKGMVDLYRVRVGDYRIVYRIEDDVLLVLVVSAGDRGAVRTFAPQALMSCGVPVAGTDAERPAVAIQRKIQTLVERSRATSRPGPRSSPTSASCGASSPPA